MEKRRVLVCDAMDAALLGLSEAFEVDYEPKITEVVMTTNAITTPHIGGQTEDAQTSAVSAAGAEISEFFG